MPTMAEMRIALAKQSNPIAMRNIGVNEAPNIDPKAYMSPGGTGAPPAGGAYLPSGLPVGGVDMSAMMPGKQFLPQPFNQQIPTQNPMGAQGLQGGMSSPVAGPPGNLLQMTRQGQMMSAMQPSSGMGNMGGMGGMSPSDMSQPPDQGMPPGGALKMAEGGSAQSADLPYDPNRPSIPSLAKAFDEAISHYRSQPLERQRELSKMASDRVGDIIGRANSGPRKGESKDLLGKNAKLMKSEKGKGTSEPLKLKDDRGVETTGLALSPAYEEGNFNTCPNHHSCKAECLGKTSGNYFKLGGGPNLEAFKGPRLNSLMKTQAFLRDPHAFAIKLHDEIQAAKDEAAKNGNHLGVRLNVLSDINPRVHKSIIEAHPDVTFYDYTKNNSNPIAPNHHYTYSSTGVSQPGAENPHTNWKQMRRRLDGGDNVAMAFTHKRHLPEHIHDEETGKKYRVIDGDTHDFRPDDMVPEGEPGVVVGLRNKKATGKMDEAHLDSKGFFVHYDPQEKKVPNAKGEMIYARDANKQTIPMNKEVRIKPQARTMVTLTNDGEKA